MDDAREIGLELLAEAAGTLLERGATHGPVRANLDRTGLLWGALLGLDVTGADVAVLLALLKVARACEGNAAHRDHWLDAIGYMALAGGLVLDTNNQI